MRKLFFSLAFLGICGVSMGQSVTDQAVIPVSVTINSVLRLQVVSGGNIQFVFNTMEQFSTGIATSDRTRTTINAASSREFNITLIAQDATLMGTSTAGTPDLDLLQYTVERIGTAGGTLSAADQDLSNTAVTIVSAAPAAGNQGYTISWRAGMGTTPATGLASDTYVTNVYLTLVPN